MNLMLEKKVERFRGEGNGEVTDVKCFPSLRSRDHAHQGRALPDPATATSPIIKNLMLEKKVERFRGEGNGEVLNWRRRRMGRRRRRREEAEEEGEDDDDETVQERIERELNELERTRRTGART
jgi:hypothetical protein